MFKYLLIAALSLLCNTVTYSQVDREFWFVAPEVEVSTLDFDKPIFFRFSTLSAPATVTISIPANPGFTPIIQNIPANSTFSVDVTSWITLIENYPANQTLNKGILIQSTNDITAYYEVVSSYCNCNPEIFALKGKNALGNEFYISSQTTYAIDTTRYPNATTGFDIVATENNTQITIIPTKDIIGHDANLPFTITLNKGQTYSAIGKFRSAAAHLHGSYVKSDKPIAITLKDDLLTGDGFCADLAGDQTIPTSILGDEYILTKGFLSPQDRYYILALEDNTLIYLDGNPIPTSTLSKGQTQSYTLSNTSTYIRSNKKIYVYHVTGYGCELGSAVIPKLNCTGSQSVSIVRSSSDNFCVMLTTRAEYQNDFSVNGNATTINSTHFSPVPGTGGGYVAARIDLSNHVSVNSAALFSNSKGKFSLGIINGSNAGSRFGFFSDFKSSNVSSSQVEICKDDSIQLNAFGGVSYEWFPTTGLNDSRIPNPKASPSSTTNYRVIITSIDGCIDSAYTNVIVNDCTPSIAAFTAPDTVCVKSELTISNTSINGSTYQWNFCVGDINKTPVATDLGNIANAFKQPVYVDYAFDNGNYYALVVNHYPAGIIRLNFGNSLLNTPTITDLGTLGGVVSHTGQAIQIVKNNGKWYAILVGGDPSLSYASQIVKIDFGTSLANTPTAVDWKNIGNLNYPHDLYLFQENNEWYGVTVNYGDNTVTRFYFGSTFDTPPTGDNLGNHGQLKGPTGICPVNDKGTWRIFVSNFDDNTISRIDFGNSLLNTPTASENLGNIGGLLHNPRDINIFEFCGQYVGFVVNDFTVSNVISRLNFSNLLEIPTITPVTSSGTNYPHSISKVFREGSDIYAFVPNTYINTISRLTFPNDCAGTIQSISNLETPTSITYSTPGTYNINLTINEGLSTQSSFCKKIVVLPQPTITIPASIEICPGTTTLLEPQVSNATKYEWTPATDLSDANIANPVASPSQTATYSLVASNAACSETADIEVKVLQPNECIPPVATFIAPDSVCINSEVTITDASVNASSYFWNFCVADVNSIPTAQNIGNPGGLLSGPVFTDFVKVNGNNYVFVVNNWTGKLTRLDFGNSLLNTPTAVDLGDLNGVLLKHAEGIQVVYNENKWYAFIVGGDPDFGITPFLVKIEFGNSITNTPVASNLGNLGDMRQPVDFYMFKDGNNWFGLTANAKNSTISRFEFGSTFQNQPIGQNLGNIGGLSYPTGINALSVEGNWYAFITNENNSTITRLDFGSSLLNAPTSINLGNPGNSLRGPRDIYVMKFCSELVGFVVNQDDNSLTRLNFENDIEQIPTATSLGNAGNFAFPHSFSKLFREGSDLYSFITNVNNHTITRIRLEGCVGQSIPNSNMPSPLPIKYTTPGTYNINLTINEGLPTQTSFCKKIVVLPKPSVDFSFEQNICNPQSMQFKNESTDYATIHWDFGNGTTLTDIETPVVVYDPYGIFDIKLKATAEGGCADSVTKKIPIELIKEDIITSKDTTLCYSGNYQLNTREAINFCWTPAAGLSATNIRNPVISTPITTTTYYLNALAPTNNLVTNGDFSQGNTGFTSDYVHTTVNTGEGEISVGTVGRSWNPGLNTCGDHTTGTGAMLMVNGSAVVDAVVWRNTVTITPNTNYAFSTWIQGLHPTNPAQLQFSINGKILGNLIQATTTSCQWIQFYTIWNSGNSATADIAVVNKNTILAGNDFALDDISFSALKMYRDSVTITIHDNPKIDFTHAINTCKTLSLTGNALSEPATITNWDWQFGDNEAQAAKALSHAYAKGGRYTVKLVATDENSCKDSIERSIQLDTATAVVSADIMVCPAELVQLTGAGGISYEWSPSNLLSDATQPNQEVRVNATTRFYLKVTDAIQCEDTASVLVEMHPRPAFNKPPDAKLCMDSSIQLSGSNDPQYTYAWQPGGDFNNSSAMNPVVAPLTTTNYTVTITAPTCNYDATFDVLVTVNPNPVIEASKQRDLDCINPTGYLYANSSSNNYLWSPANGVDTPTSAHPMAWIDTTTHFVVKTTNEFDCSAYASVLVKVTNYGRPVFNIPNAFTPNNDGKNDCFRLKHWGNVKINRLIIYNRWGQQVFSTTDPMECWDGTYKGVMQPAGTFVYIIQATSFCGPLERKGTLTLIR